MRPRRQIPRGWVLLDVLVGTMIISILGALLNTAATKYDRAAHHLDDTRAAIRQAESTLLTLQAGQTLAADKSLSIQKLSDPTAQIPGLSWVKVRAAVNTRTAELIGLVPQTSIPGGAK